VPNRFSHPLTDIPEVACAANGSLFSPRDECWTPWDITGEHTINFGLLRRRCTGGFILSAKKVFLWYLENFSVSGAFTRFNDFIFVLETLEHEQLRTYPRATIEPSEILRARSLLGLEYEYRLNSIRSVLIRWSEMGYKGVPVETAKVLQKLKLKGNEKGAAVLTRDPYVGPFTEAELHSIHSAANTAFAEGKMGLRPYCMLWIFLALGVRPIQAALLKLDDLKVIKDCDNGTKYVLEMPRVKQRGGHTRRESFRGRPLIPDIGELVQAQINDVERQYQGKIDDWEGEVKDLPLFPNWAAEGPDELRYHSYSHDIGAELVRSLNSLGVISGRTGKLIKYSVYRFRRTLGTRAAQEGLNEFTIAELLDHSSLQSAIVYVKAVPKILANIEKSVADQLAPLVAAFKGEVIEDETQAKRYPDTSSRLISPELSTACGHCGHDGYCGILAPLGCYVCPHFQALANGPHEEVLEGLLARREEILKHTNDLRIASTNDQLIFAVSQVVQSCKRITSQDRAGADGHG